MQYMKSTEGAHHCILACSHPETAIFCNFVVRLQLCTTSEEYDSDEFWSSQDVVAHRTVGAFRYEPW